MQLSQIERDMSLARMIEIAVDQAYRTPRGYAVIGAAALSTVIGVDVSLEDVNNYVDRIIHTKTRDLPPAMFEVRESMRSPIPGISLSPFELIVRVPKEVDAA